MDDSKLEKTMVNALLLDDTAISEVMEFYQTHAHDEVLYPRDPKWVKDNLGTNFFLTGIRIGKSEELAAVAWMAKLKDFVYFTVDDEKLSIKNSGNYAYSGGWCVRPDCRGLGMFQLLAAAVNLFWFTKITRNEPIALWGRMVGIKDTDGCPLFWNKVGEKISGLSYRNLLALPFGSMERAIFTRWPKEPMPLADISSDVLNQTLGKTYKPLIGPLNQFLRWNLVKITNRYALTSLNCFFVTTKDSIPDPAIFFNQALSKALNVSQ